MNLRALAANTTRELNILGHDGYTLGMNGAQVGVFKQPNKVCFRSLLKGKDGSTLETQVRLEVLGNFTNQTLERGLANEKVRRLLVLADFTKSNSSWAVTVGLLDASGSGSTLACGLSSWWRWNKCVRQNVNNPSRRNSTATIWISMSLHENFSLAMAVLFQRNMIQDVNIPWLRAVWIING